MTRTLINRPSFLRRHAYVFRELIHTFVLTKKRRSRTKDGFEFIASSYESNQKMLRAKYEDLEYPLIRNLIEKCDVFVDVGANIGYYTCVGLNRGKRVVSIEPKRSNLDVLYQNMTINKWENDCQIYPVGVSDKQGLALLYGATGTAASLIGGWAGHWKCFRETIPVLTLDQILGVCRDDDNVFVKIDVEGLELKVLEGAQHLLKRLKHSTWLVEICLSEYHPRGLNPHFRETFQMMWQNGFEAYNTSMLNAPLKPSDVDSIVESGGSSFNSSNYIFVKDEAGVAE